MEVLDKSISQAETVLPDNIESHKTIFGLKESWIEDNKIKKEYLEKLKKASEELALDPIGFLVSSESIVNLLQKEEGAPITAVLVELGEKFITVSLVKSGKIMETKSSEIHQSTPFTVDTLLKHFQTPEVMPSRIIIYGADDEEVTQEFIGHPWSKSLPFLHLPQITSLPKDTSIKAMLLGAATQMGAQLLYDSLSVDFDEEPKKISADEFPNFEPVKTPEEFTQEKSESEKTKPITETKGLNEELPTEPKTVGKAPDFVNPDESLAYFGFMEGADVAKTPKVEAPSVQEKVPDEVVKEEFAEIPQEEKMEEERKIGFVENALIMASRIKNFGLKSLRMILAPGRLKGKTILLIPAAILILLILGLLLLMFNRKATITILVNPKSDQKTTSVTFSSSKATDIGSGIIASQPVSVSEDGTISTNASGQTDVGTAAKGTVTIFNIGTGSLTVPSGTTITSPNGLDFTLDNAVTVASGDAILGASTATVNVTASDIGQDYNLPSGTKFTVAGEDSSVAAKNDNAFSGGVKKSVTVISKNDLQKLLNGLPTQLAGKAKSDIQSKVTGDNVLLSSFTSETVSNQSFDKKAGDQASSVTLKGTVDFESLTYNSSDMLSFANSLFSGNNAQISKDNLSVTAKNIVVNSNGDISADLTIGANLLPKINSDQLLKQIAGNPIQKARDQLSSLPQVENVGIDLKPNIPFFAQNLPGNPKNITIQITSK